MYPPAPGTEYAEAGLDVLRFEKSLKDSVSRSGEQLVDRVGPDGFGGGVVTGTIVVVGQWPDEVSPHEVVVEQAPLDEISNERCPANKAKSLTAENRAAFPIYEKVLCRSYRNQSKDVRT